MDESERATEFAQAVSLFNQREFFACHDVLEEIWSETLGDEREILQGFIHVAVALFHFSEGNLSGARKMHDSALIYLSRANGSYRGIDVTRLIADFDRCLQPLLGNISGYPVNVVLDEQTIPTLKSQE